MISNVIQQKSWSSLYQNFKCYYVGLENNEIRITPLITNVIGKDCLDPHTYRVVILELSDSKYAVVARVVIDMLS